MKSPVLRTGLAAITAALCLSPPAFAEDIDLFTTPSTGGVNPNILIMIDNSANWNSNAQKWPVGKQGEGELEALRLVLNEPFINSSINMGLMLLQSGVDGGYVRYAIRPMNNINKLGFQEMIGTSACVTGSTNSVTGVAGSNCIYKTFSGTGDNQNNSASTQFSAAMFEAFKYFGGYTSPAGALTNTPGAPIDSTHFGMGRYAGSHKWRDPFAFDGTGTTYVSPINADGSNSCANNYIIFISNGLPPQDLPPSILSGVGGDVAFPLPQKSVYAANWAKFLYQTDVNAVAGRQFVRTYTIDVFNAKQDVDATALTKNMAKFGGGRYFQARDNQQIINALREILVEIQGVNSVFASASLPINATNRSQNENQVFIGMFRPDPAAQPRWYGNLKRFQIGSIGGEIQLADRNNQPALSASTGFLQSCATSFWTTFGGPYWAFNPDSAGSCPTPGVNPASDAPDGAIVEKGGTAQVLRRGNDPTATAPFVVNRTMFTCTGACGALTPFNETNVTQARTGALTAAEHTNLINYTRGMDVFDENLNAAPAPGGIGAAEGLAEPRPSIHADIVHSRPLPVNFGGTRGVEVFYGANDGPFRAMSGTTGQEVWSFIAPEHHAKLKRLADNSPRIAYPNLPPALLLEKKGYFFDGSVGLYQNIDNSKVWIFPTMRRGGRMVYAFDVTNPTPVLLWSKGCPNPGDDSGCSADYSQIGQTWSVPNVAFIKGYTGGVDPILIMGGGYDGCEDTDSSLSTCVTPKGNRVYVINAATGVVLKQFTTTRSVAADVTLVDRDFDGNVDHAYVADMGGALYRIDFVEPGSNTVRAVGAWSISKIAESTVASSRKFIFGPSALSVADKVFLTIGSGDRERPLVTNYPYQSSVENRFYMFIDRLTAGATVSLDGGTMENFTATTGCSTLLADEKNGWFLSLAGRGEQTVTSSVIFGGTVFFSTNRPLATAAGTCQTNLGEARGYALNLFNASGVIGTGDLCGGERSGTFTGGGIPPSPVVGVVPVNIPGSGVKPVNVLIGGINLQTGSGSPISAQQPPIPIKQIRSRLYWYPKADK